MCDETKSPSELAKKINERLFTAASMVYLVGRLSHEEDGEDLEIHVNEWSKVMGRFVSDTQALTDTLESALEGQGHE